MVEPEVIEWLLHGDVSIQYQTYRDLLGEHHPELRERIPEEGWGEGFLSKQNPDGHWGRGFYQVKWVSSHYTLLDLRYLELPRMPRVTRTILDIIDQNLESDGGVNPGKTIKNSDICINGMFLNYATFFGVPQEPLMSIVDFLLGVQMGDGGFNCKSNRDGAVHSSLHTTLSVLEGFHEYKRQGYTYRLDEITEVEPQAKEFILQHRLYKSDHTGKVIDKRFLMLSYPSRWRYDNLRALDYFRYSETPYDERMGDAVEVLYKKRRKDGTWPVQAKHSGQTHFDMEETGKPSRWNTLRALRVLSFYDLL